MGPISCPETSERNYHSSLRNIPGERGALVCIICALRLLSKTRYILPQARLYHWVCYIALVAISWAIGLRQP